jgi:hypothetical protein
MKDAGWRLADLILEMQITKPLNLTPSSLRLRNQFVNQHSDAINQCGDKYALGSFITMYIYIDRKKNGIGEQGDTANSS